MECYSQVCAIDGDIEEGHLKINGQVIDFSNGKYYIEKNWEKVFLPHGFGFKVITSRITEQL